MVKPRFGRRRVAALTVAAGLVVAACTGGQQATQSGGEVIELTIGSAVTSATIPPVAALDDYFVDEVRDRVAAETDHEVEFVELWGTFVRVGEELEAVRKGQLDLGTVSAAYQPSELPLHNLSYYVPFASPDMRVSVAALRAALEEHESFAAVFPEQYNQVNLGFLGYGNYGLITNFAWDDLEDLQGRAIAGVGPNLEWLRPIGATRVQQPAGEWYTSLQTGVVDGIVVLSDGIPGMRLYELARQFTVLDLGPAPVIAINVNRDTWEALPDDVRTIVAEVAREAEDRGAAIANDTIAEAYEIMEAEGVDVVEAGPELREQWAQLLDHLPGQRAREADDAGLPGTEVIRSFIRSQIDQGHEFPVDYDL